MTIDFSKLRKRVQNSSQIRTISPEIPLYTAFFAIGTEVVFTLNELAGILSKYSSFCFHLPGQFCFYLTPWSRIQVFSREKLKCKMVFRCFLSFRNIIGFPFIFGNGLAHII